MPIANLVQSKFTFFCLPNVSSDKHISFPWWTSSQERWRGTSSQERARLNACFTSCGNHGLRFWWIMVSWHKCVVLPILENLWVCYHTKPSAGNSRHRIGNSKQTRQCCSNSAKIGEQHASSLPKLPSRGTRRKMFFLTESTSLQVQSPCNQQWQLVNHPIVSSSCSKRPRGGTPAEQ